MRTADEIREAKREYMRQARLDPVKRDRWNASRRGRYLEEMRVHRAKVKRGHFFRYRALRYGGLTGRDLMFLWKRQRGRCALSGRKLGRDAHLDHIVPLSLGGASTVDNFRWLDPKVNLGRREMSDDEFVAMCSEVVQWTEA